MQTEPEIVFHNLDHSPAIETLVRERLEKLDRLFDGIVSCRVVIERSQHRHRKGDLFAVNIVVGVPGQQLVVNRAGPKDHAHEDIKVALRDSFDAAGRQVEDHARKVRGDVKHHEPRPESPPENV